MMKRFLRSLISPFMRIFSRELRNLLLPEVLEELRIMRIAVEETHRAQKESDALYFSLISSMRNPLPELEESLNKFQARAAGVLNELEARLAALTPPERKSGRR